MVSLSKPHPWVVKGSYHLVVDNLRKVYRIMLAEKLAE